MKKSKNQTEKLKRQRREGKGKGREIAQRAKEMGWKEMVLKAGRIERN